MIPLNFEGVVHLKVQFESEMLDDRDPKKCLSTFLLMYISKCYHYCTQQERKFHLVMKQCLLLLILMVPLLKLISDCDTSTMFLLRYMIIVLTEQERKFHLVMKQCLLLLILMVPLFKLLSDWDNAYFHKVFVEVSVILSLLY